MTPEQEIEYWQSKFRILKEWKIEYDTDTEYSDQCCHGVENKLATIYKKTTAEADYFFHEILHICQAHLRHLYANEHGDEYWARRNAEEEYVQDLCTILLELARLPNQT